MYRVLGAGDKGIKYRTDHLESNLKEIRVGAKKQIAQLYKVITKCLSKGEKKSTIKSYSGQAEASKSNIRGRGRKMQVFRWILKNK